jgi:hypothetical protein
VTGADWQLANPGPNLWFNPAAFAAPARYRFGNSAPGAVVGPASHVLDTGFMKNFNFTESKYLQFRWEMFNAMNEVNLRDPVTTIGLATTGQITGAGDARQIAHGARAPFLAVTRCARLHALGDRVRHRARRLRRGRTGEHAARHQACGPQGGAERSGGGSVAVHAADATERLTSAFRAVRG